MRRLTKTHGHARTSSIIGPLALHICLTNNFAKQPALFYPINDMLFGLGKPFLGIDFFFHPGDEYCKKQQQHLQRDHTCEIELHCLLRTHDARTHEIGLATGSFQNAFGVIKQEVRAVPKNKCFFPAL